MKSFLLPAYALWHRELVRFFRKKSRIVAALGTPLLFWFFLSSGVGESFQTAGGTNYAEYFYPGTLLMVIMFTAVFSSISVIEDRNSGFWVSVQVSAAGRTGPVLGKVAGGATLAILQGVFFLLLAPLAGFSMSPVSFLLAVVFVALNSIALTSLGAAFAWRMDSIQGFHGVMNLLLFPMWLLSGALFPASGASSWIQWTMTANPLFYGLAALRTALSGTTDSSNPDLILSTAVVIGFALLLFLLAFVTAPRRQQV